MDAAANELGEVVVKAYRPVLKQEGTRIITNVAQSTLSKLPTAEHLIAFLPGVSRSYTTQEPFLVFSKGAPIFYINNRRIRNVEEVMRISPSEVESVSIETQPGAEFDNSIGAVIYIQLKKKQGDGLSGSLFNGEDFKQGQFVEGGVELNYRKGKTDVFLVTEANLNFATRRNSTEELTVSTPLQQWQVQTSNEAKNNRRKLSTRLGLNHELSDKHSVGFKLSARTSPLGGHDHTTQETATYRNALLTAQAANAYDRLYKDYNIDGNAYYDGQLSPNLKMQTDLDYRYAHSDHHTTIEERDLLGGMGPLQMRNLATQSDAELRWGAVKTTFNQSLGKTMLTYGVEASTLGRDDAYADHRGASPAIRNKETQSAGFVSVSFPYNKLRFKLGTRYEYADFGYYENEVKNTVKSRTYRDFLPNVSVTFPWDKLNFSLSYARKIRRPAYYQLSDYDTYITSYLYNRGNAELAPQLSSDFNLLTSYKHYALSLQYSLIDDAAYTLYRLSSNPAVVENTLVNAGRFETFKAVFTAQGQIGSWMPKLTASLGKQFSHGIFEADNPICTISWENTYMLSEGWIAMGSLEYSTTGNNKNVYRYGSGGGLGLFLIHTMCEGRLTLFGGVIDIFDTYKNKTMEQSPYVSQRNYGDTNMRALRLGLEYKFNPTQSKYKGQGTGSGQKERM
ncbi:TonB-dependent receptor domain-containing protein [Capnocytophaga haemolytica]